MKKLLLALLLSFSLGAFAANPVSLDFELPHIDRMSNLNYGLEAAFDTELFLDYKQSIQIKDHPGMYEVNPLIGSHPTDAHYRNYFITASLLHLGITELMPEKYRTAWQTGGIIVEGIQLGKNKQLGLTIKF